MDFSASANSALGTVRSAAAKLRDQVRSVTINESANASVATRPTSHASEVSGPTIGKSGFKTWEEFNTEGFKRYQQYVDDAFAAANKAESEGLLRGNKNTRIGNAVDQQSRARMRAWLDSEGIAEGSGQLVQLNRWLRDPSGSGSYVRPDFQSPGAIMDATVGKKPPGTTQLERNEEYSGIPTTIVRPTMLGGSCTILICQEK